MNSKPMEVHEIVTADGELFTLANGIDRWMMDVSGFGMPPLEYATEKGYRQDGVTVVNRSLGERTINLTYDAYADCRNEYWDARRRLIDILRFNRGGDFWFRHWREDNQLYEILARYGSGARFEPFDPGSGRGAHNISEPLTFLCADPVWYGTEYTYTATVVISAFLQFPFYIPDEFLFGSSTATVNATISYLGDYPSYPTIELTGPFNSVYFRNNTTGKRVAWVYPVPSGETVTIILTNLGPEITSSLGTAFSDAFSATLTRDSSPIETYIAPHPEALNGVNDITVLAGGGSPVTELIFSYRDRWQGI